MKTVNSLNLIFLATEYWFKALKCQIWLTNTKPFFWESEAKVETLPKHSSYIWVSYKFVLKSVKSLNWILWATKYWFKTLKCQIWFTNTKPFFLGKRGSRWDAPKTFSLYLSFLKIYFEVCQKPKSNLMSYRILVQGFKMPNLVDEYKSIFLEKRSKCQNSPKTFSINLSFL